MIHPSSSGCAMDKTASTAVTASKTASAHRWRLAYGMIRLIVPGLTFWRVMESSRLNDLVRPPEPIDIGWCMDAATSLGQGAVHESQRELPYQNDGRLLYRHDERSTEAPQQLNINFSGTVVNSKIIVSSREPT
jgi:hypothetical protein